MLETKTSNVKHEKKEKCFIPKFELKNTIINVEFLRRTVRKKQTTKDIDWGRKKTFGETSAPKQQEKKKRTKCWEWDRGTNLHCT